MDKYNHKISFITDTLSSGGSERVISILSNNLINQNYDVTIICIRTRTVFYEINPKVRIIYVEDSLKKPNWIKRFIALRSIILKGEYDVIIPFMVRIYIFTIISLLFSNQKIIASERNDPKKIPLWMKMVRNLSLLRVNCLVAQTNHIKECFPKYIQQKIKVIFNPTLLNIDPGNRWNSNSKEIVTIGRLDPQKNHKLLISAMVEVHKKFPEFRLSIYGKGSLENELARIIEQHNASSYIFLKGRSSDIDKILKEAYMFVMTSDYEGFSNALIEAVCSGLPIISTKVSGATDIIENSKNGFLVDVKDKKNLIASIEYLILNKETSKKFAEEILKSADQFNLDNILSKWSTIIDLAARE